MTLCPLTCSNVGLAADTKPGASGAEPPPLTRPGSGDHPSPERCWLGAASQAPDRRRVAPHPGRGVQTLLRYARKAGNGLGWRGSYSPSGP